MTFPRALARLGLGGLLAGETMAAWSRREQRRALFQQASALRKGLAGGILASLAAVALWPQPQREAHRLASGTGKNAAPLEGVSLISGPHQRPRRGPGCGFEHETRSTRRVDPIGTAWL